MLEPLKGLMPQMEAMKAALPLPTISAWLAPVRDQIPQDLTAEEAGELAAAVTHEALSRLEAFMAGLRAYQNSAAVPPSRNDVRCLWQKGSTRLWDYAPEQKEGPAILIVPSLVNRFVILDIDEERSFLRYLAAQGFRPLVVDWDAPSKEEQPFALSDYMTERLFPILEFAQSVTGGAPLHLLGYCMGGVLALALALHRPNALRSLTLMATPWDFSVGGVGGVPAAESPVGHFFLEQALRWQPQFEAAGIVPASVLQTVLTCFQPMQVLQKYLRFAQGPKEAGAARRFVLTEDWLNDGVALTATVARECLQGWYAENALPSLTWEIAGRALDPRALRLPVALMAPRQDRIVPPASALPLAALMPDVTLFEPDVGHIGLMVGEKARTLVWEPYIAWLRGVAGTARS